MSKKCKEKEASAFIEGILYTIKAILLFGLVCVQVDVAYKTYENRKALLLLVNKEVTECIKRDNLGIVGCQNVYGGK